MSRPRAAALAVAALLGLGSAAAIGACGEDRGGSVTVEGAGTTTTPSTTTTPGTTTTPAETTP